MRKHTRPRYMLSLDDGTELWSNPAAAHARNLDGPRVAVVVVKVVVVPVVVTTAISKPDTSKDLDIAEESRPDDSISDFSAVFNCVLKDLLLTLIFSALLRTEASFEAGTWTVYETFQKSIAKRRNAGTSA